MWIAWLCLSHHQAAAAAAVADDTSLQELHEQLHEKVMAFYYVW